MAGSYSTCEPSASSDLENHDSFLPDIYDELRNIAASLMTQENSGHTLQATALVNEAWLRLNRQTLVINDRNHMIALVTSQMRRALIDHARRKNAAKRPSHGLRIALDHQETASSDDTDVHSLDLIDLCTALDELFSLNKRHCQVFELRFFGGLSVEDSAEYLKVSPRTVKSDWKFAGAWLAQRLDLSAHV